MTDDNEADPLVQMAIQNELISRAEDLRVEELPNGDISVSGTVTIPVVSRYPGGLVKVTL
jgi:hypothetical protein